MPEDHIIFGKGACFVSENKFDLSQVLVDRCVVGRSETLVLAGVAVSIFDENRPLEEFDHFHGNHEWDRDEVSHQEPPGQSSDPVVGHRNELSHLPVAVLKDGVEERADESDDDLPDEDLDDYFIYLQHQFPLLWFKFGWVEDQFGVWTSVATDSNDFMNVFDGTASEEEVLGIERDFQSRNWNVNWAIEFIYLLGRSSTGDLVLQGLVVVGFGNNVGDVVEKRVL